VLRGRFFFVHRRERDPDEETVSAARLGLVVPKKLCKLAVRRNQAKRVVREAFRQQRAGLPACDLVFRLAVNVNRLAWPAAKSLLAADARALLARCRAPRPPA
jgi:ribonuclease P protein component